MKITFVLPRCMANPSGGFRIVYRFANIFAQHGFKVYILYETSNNLEKLHNNFIKKIYGKIIVNLRPSWFNLNKSIKKISGFDLNKKFFPDADFVVATSVETAESVNSLPVNKGKKIYLIQDFENWNFSDDFVISTYKLPMKKIVISNWLKKEVEKYVNYGIDFVPNAIDLDTFYVTKSLKDRNKFQIAFLYSKRKSKGYMNTLKTIRLLKKKFSKMTFVSFGVFKRGVDLPNWVDYYKSPSQDKIREIYNDSTFFINSSLGEGFGLTGAESMACGCCLVSTDYNGVREYAKHMKNSFLVPIDKPVEMYNAICYLIENDKIRTNLCNEAIKSISERTWENSFNTFSEIIKN